MKLQTLLFVLFSASALADPSRLYIGTSIRSGGPVRDQSSDQNEYTQAAPALALQLEIPDTIDTDMHFYATHSRHKMKPVSNEYLSVTQLQLGGAKYLQAGQVRPYLGATLGGSLIDAPDSRQLHPAFTLYGGGHWSLGKQSAIKLEARWLGTLIRTDASLLCDPGCTAKIKSGLWSQFEIGAWFGFGF